MSSERVFPATYERVQTAATAAMSELGMNPERDAWLGGCRSGSGRHAIAVCIERVGDAETSMTVRPRAFGVGPIALVDLSDLPDRYIDAVARNLR